MWLRCCVLVVRCWSSVAAVVCYVLSSVVVACCGSLIAVRRGSLLVVGICGLSLAVDCCCLLFVVV